MTTTNIQNVHGGTGGPGGYGGQSGGSGGVGQGNTFYADQVHVENMYGSSGANADLLPWFAPKALFNADAAAGGPARRACTDNTRIGLISRLKKWARDTSDNSSPIFWLSGMAGTGKSTVAYTLCKHWRKEGRLGASFFCSRNDEKARSRAFIIPTIVRQLLDIHKPFAHSLRDVRIDVIPASAYHVDKLLVKPWSQSIASQPSQQPRSPLVVVIDALDEIEGNDQGPQLIKQIIQAVSASKMRLRGLKFFVTSRPHPRIKEECRSIAGKAMYRMEEIDPKEALEDVRRFVDAELAVLAPDRREVIVTNSSGLFIYAATVVRYVCPPDSMFPPSVIQQRQSLDTLLTAGVSAKVLNSKHGIDSLYDTILTQALTDIGQGAETSKRVLYAVVTTRRPLTVADLAPLVIGDPTEEVDEQAVHNSVRSFYAVLYISPRNKCIYTFHKSFADFILDPGRSRERATAATSYFRDRTHDCFRILNKSLRFNICNLKSSFLLDKDDKGLSKRVKTKIGPELRYACQHWAAHLASVRHDCQKDVQQLSALLLNFHKLKVLFWMEAMNLIKSDCRLAIHLARTWVLQLQVQNAELNEYMAASQRLWASFFQGQVSLSTPHLYVSSLATELALTSAMTLTNWRWHFPGRPSIECKGISLTEDVSSVTFSPDGTHVVSGSFDKTVRIWDTTTGAELTRMEGHSDHVCSVAFSPDGACVVSGSDDKTVRIWDVTTGAEVTKIVGHRYRVCSVAFSPNSVRVVSGSADGTVRIWDATTGTEVTKMEGHHYSVTSVAFSPDSARIVSGSQDKTVRVWDVETGMEVSKMEEHSDTVTAVAFSPNGACFVSGSDDQTMRIGDATTGAEITKMEGHRDSVTSVAFSPDGAYVTSGSLDKTVRIWDVTTGAEVTKLEGHSYSVTSVAFSPDSARIVSGSGDETVRIWDATTGIEMTKMEGHSYCVYSVAFSPDGKHIVSGSGDETVRIWDMKTGAEVTKMEGHSDSVTSVAFSPNGAHVVSGSFNKIVQIWEATTGVEVIKMEGHSMLVTSVAFSPDSTRIVSGSGDETVRIWDVTTGAEVTKMEGHSDRVCSVAFSPDGARVVSGSDDGTVRIWDARTGTEVTKIEGYSYSVTSVAFSPDGARIVSGSDNKTVWIWDATTGAEVTKMEGHSKLVTSVAFSPDGRRVVSGSFDKTVRVWDATMGTEVTRMEQHSDVVTSVAFSPDGAYVASGSYDETIRIWDVRTGAEVAHMQGHSELVRSVAFSPDGTPVVSGSGDKTVEFFQLSDFWIFENGWVVQCGHPNIRLFWYPPELQHTLFFPPCLRLIAKLRQTRLEFHARTLGTGWQQIYHSPRPTSSVS
ncbi:WD40 repeat-like protein [Mycena sanguinolenta]|uniref:WD40 repeat-like protein n=1 Tax=Mycena sanguinolenta TaxID=230812 RepID=A0A8H6ZJ33_9AGAR|nr:WD40 repeat-like protein [Mycena sanguinolenta]